MTLNLKFVCLGFLKKNFRYIFYKDKNLKINKKIENDNILFYFYQNPFNLHCIYLLFILD